MGKQKGTRLSRKTWCMIGAAVLIALPFFAGAIAIGWHAVALPKTAGQLILAQLLGAALFAFGFSIAFVSSVAALAVDSSDRRRLAVAGILLGCCHIALGFVIRRTIEGAALSSDLSYVPILVPIVLWAASIWLALASATPVRKSEEAFAETANEEQPQLLSPP